MFGELIGEIVRQVLLPLVTNVASTAINNAMAPAPPKPQQGSGFTGPMQGGPNPPGQAVGGGSAVRPSAGMFAGGFTGQPPGGMSQGLSQSPVQGGQGGFNLLDRVRPSQPTGGI